MSVACYFRPGSKRKILAGNPPHWIANHKTRSAYLRAAVLSYPPWVDKWEIEALRAWAAALTTFHGELYVMAHCVPLTHPLVSGLSVPWNFKIVHWRVNASEGNWFTPDQIELFP